MLYASDAMAKDCSEMACTRLHDEMWRIYSITALGGALGGASMQPGKDIW